MIRSFVVAIVTVFAVTGAGPLNRLAAQTIISQFKVEAQGGSQDEFVEVYLNQGKVADVKLDTAGAAAWVLDLGNMGKSKVQIYFDVCENGKVEKVLFATGGTPPKDEDCDRRPVGAGFQSDCGVTKITLDLRRFGANVLGCGNFFTSKTGIATTVGGVLLTGLVVTLPGDGTTSSSSTSSAPVTTNTPVNNNPVTTNPTNPTPSPAPGTPVEFTLTFTGGAWDHATGVSGQSDACGRFTTTPPQANAPFVIQVSGPGVLQQTVTGVTNAQGVGTFRARINLVGTYGFSISITSQGVTRTGTGSVLVTTAPSSCLSS